VLLLYGGDPAARERGAWWFTPGGGAEAGESRADAARREAAEETGLVLAEHELGEPVLHRVARFAFDGSEYEQTEDIFLVRVASFEVSAGGRTELEQRFLEGHRWWSVDELRTTTDTVYPEQLADLLDRLLDIG
jgi:8-oxo-dGTP pyrophosphatase MutT (NUDIX family)